MKKTKIHIILILVSVLITPIRTLAQCDFFGTVSVVAASYTTDPGYIQTYILVEDNSGTQGNILAYNTDGNFGQIDEGSYFIYAANYSGAQPNELDVGESYTNLYNYSQLAENCFVMSGAYLNRAVNVCSADDICLGNPIEIAVQDYTVAAGYEIRYILVDPSDGTVVDFNSDGSFGIADYGSAGNFEAYALSTNDSDLILDLTDGMLFSDFSDLADATCAGILGPRTVTVLDNNFVYVADNQTAEATAFCEVDGWTHYSTASNPHDFIFSIYKNSNDISATVFINVADASNDYLTSASNDEYSTTTLRRSWSVDASGSDYNSSTGELSNPVKVRFYYPSSEKQLVEQISEDFVYGSNTYGANITPYNHSYIRESAWFKSNNGEEMDLNAMTTAEQIINAYELDVIGDDLTTSNGVNYVELGGITGFSGGTFASGTGPGIGNVLPVEYLYLKAFANDNYDLIEWATSSEINCDYFELEVSRNLVDFITPTQIKGQGNTNQITYYSFKNYNFYNGDSYYRLKQVDFDGSYKYSKIVSVSRESGEYEILVYPNPFSDNIKIDFTSVPEGENAKVLIYNSLGQLLFEDSLEIYSQDIYKVNTEYLPDGAYMIKALINDQAFAFKTLKQSGR